jgi:hypothetical protein
VALTMVVGLGLGALALNMLNDLRLGHASRTWPSVKGRIIDAYVHEAESADATDDAFTAKLRYSFVVSGAQYQGDNLRFGGPLSRRPFSRAERDLKGHVAGDEVRVFYHPKYPLRCTLLVGCAAESYFEVVICSAIALTLLFS